MSASLPTAITDVDVLIARCRAVTEQEPIRVSCLVELLDAVAVDPRTLDIEPARPGCPYGRRVLMANDAVELMVASWARDQICAPHDHGGSVGGVKVLQGCAHHHVWRIGDGRLDAVGTRQIFERDDVLSCGPELIHSMGDGGAELPLITLHLYVAAIEQMVIYDPHGDRTMVVDGSCGAWVPTDGQGIRHSRPGIWPRREIFAEAAALG